MSPRPNRIVLDTNLLLLLLVGQTDKALLRQFKRVQSFASQDIDLLAELLRPYSVFVTTPHILSETSNFVEQAPPWHRATLIDRLKNYIDTGVEIYQPATNLIERDEFNALGLTDTAMAHLSSEAVVLTVDFRLAGKINAIGGNSINFNHYRKSLFNPL